MVRKKFNTILPDTVNKVHNLFKKHNYEVFLVGGCVRDLYMGIEPKDYDFVTNVIPDEIERIFQIEGYKTIPTGKQFGIINVIVDGEEFEIATFRIDQTKGRKPEVKLSSTIESDAARRDLRINALYYDMDTNEIIDLVGGLEDLKNGIVQTVGNPQERFEEDPLRIMRFFRFLCRFS